MTGVTWAKVGIRNEMVLWKVWFFHCFKKGHCLKYNLYVGFHAKICPEKQFLLKYVHVSSARLGGTDWKDGLLSPSVIIRLYQLKASSVLGVPIGKGGWGGEMTWWNVIMWFRKDRTVAKSDTVYFNVKVLAVLVPLLPCLEGPLVEICTLQWWNFTPLLVPARICCSSSSHTTLNRYLVSDLRVYQQR